MLHLPCRGHDEQLARGKGDLPRMSGDARRAGMADAVGSCRRCRGSNQPRMAWGRPGTSHGWGVDWGSEPQTATHSTVYKVYFRCVYLRCLLPLVPAVECQANEACAQKHPGAGFGDGGGDGLHGPVRVREH
jgi:hypothetical protein